MPCTREAVNRNPGMFPDYGDHFDATDVARSHQVSLEDSLSGRAVIRHWGFPIVWVYVGKLSTRFEKIFSILRNTSPSRASQCV